jgi:hypothetical protein
MWVKNKKIAVAYWVGWLVCICFIFYFDTIDEYRHAEKAEAVVVSKLVGTTRRGSYYYPQFRFEYKDSSYLFANRRKTYFLGFEVGDKATVIFPAGDPERAIQYTFLSYWVSLSKLFFSFMISLFLFVIPIFYRWYAEFNQTQRETRQ